MPDDEVKSLRVQLHSLEVSVGVLVSRFDNEFTRALQEIKQDVHALSGHIVGDENQVGLLVRIDRLEQDKQRRDRLVWLLISTVAALVANSVYQWIAG